MAQYAHIQTQKNTIRVKLLIFFRLEAERSNERAEGVESKFIDIEDELKVRKQIYLKKYHK